MRTLWRTGSTSGQAWTSVTSSSASGQARTPVLSGSTSGQAVVEFVFTLLLFLGVIMVFVQIGLALGAANYFQYATYISARTLAAAGSSEQDQVERAERVLRAMVTGRGGKERWPGIARSKRGRKPPRALASVNEGNSSVDGAIVGKGPGFDPNVRDYSWIEGVQYSFHSKIFLPAGGTTSDDNEITLTSEAWLGREPSYQECVDQLKSNAKGGAVLYDNGC